MRLMVWILLLFAAGPAPAGAADPVPAPPLACPQCGHWELAGASHGMTGEWMAIRPDRVDFPALGWFCARTIEQSVKDEGRGRRGYRVVLELTPRTDDCATPGGQGLRMQVDVDAGGNVEGSHARMRIRRGAEPVFDGEAWNVDREDPCDSGSNTAFIACHDMDHARLYKQLSLEAYGIRRSLAGNAAASFARRFSPDRFVDDVERFCDRQGSLRGAGSGATLVSKQCQVERMAAKLRELEAWQACMRKGERACTTPDQRFDTSATE